MPLLRNLSYGVMIELVLGFSKQTVSKYAINEFLEGKMDSTCFVVDGVLMIEARRRHSVIDELMYNDEWRQSRYSIHHHHGEVHEMSSKLLRLEKGGLLYIDDEGVFRYVCESESCEIIYVKTDLLNYYLTP